MRHGYRAERDMPEASCRGPWGMGKGEGCECRKLCHWRRQLVVGGVCLARRAPHHAHVPVRVRAYLQASGQFYRSEGERLVAELDVPAYLKHCEVRPGAGAEARPRKGGLCTKAFGGG